MRMDRVPTAGECVWITIVWILLIAFFVFMLIDIFSMFTKPKSAPRPPPLTDSQEIELKKIMKRKGPWRTVHRTESDMFFYDDAGNKCRVVLEVINENKSDQKR